MQLADEIVIMKVDASNRIQELEGRVSKYQSDIVKSQKMQVSAEAKLKSQSILYEERMKNVSERKDSLEQEVAASRYWMYALTFCGVRFTS